MNFKRGDAVKHVDETYHFAGFVLHVFVTVVQVRWVEYPGDDEGSYNAIVNLDEIVKL